MSGLFSAFGSNSECNSSGLDSVLPINSRVMPRVEKDTDDPSSPAASANTLNRRGSTTLTTLSRLFATQSGPSPGLCRHGSSFIEKPLCQTACTNQFAADSPASLSEHLLGRGLLEGKHSDIIVNAFGKPYRLHRLVLDRAPFFASALSEQWLKSDATELNIQPEDVDPSITQSSFELALRRLYGCADHDAEGHESISLFATGCWLELRDLVQSSTELILRQMAPENLSTLIALVTNNYYGQAGDRILASAKAMLYRDGWRMPLRYWDGIPAGIIHEVVGGDGLFIDSEWDRWMLAKRLLNRRLKVAAPAMDLVDVRSQRRLKRASSSVTVLALRRGARSHGKDTSTEYGKYMALYLQAEIEPLCSLLDHRIHYIHMDFEQLQVIRQARDVLSFPVVYENVINQALWQQIELRQKVINIPETDSELGLIVQSTNGATSRTDDESQASTSTPATTIKTTEERSTLKPSDTLGHKEGEQSPGFAFNKPQKYWIPTADSNVIMGGKFEPVIAPPPRNSNTAGGSQNVAAAARQENLQRAAESSVTTTLPQHLKDQHNGPSPPYTHFPPFRFAAEFPDPRTLKERKRVYSRTIFYAGSFWNIYIQKVHSSRSRQLGVYLHRAKEYGTEEVIVGTAGLAHGNVDERIGRLEREMLRRNARRERREVRQSVLSHHDADVDGAEGSESGGDTERLPRDFPVVEGEQPAVARPTSIRGIPSREPGRHEQANPLSAGQFVSHGATSRLDETPYPDSDTGDDDSELEHLATAYSKSHIPTLPPYIDRRPTIRTYFKIFSPSRGGRMLSVYESAPDKFDFSQSWGWKSSTLMLDEGLPSEEFDDVFPKEDYDQTGEKEYLIDSRHTRADGKLRFMVVIGMI